MITMALPLTIYTLVLSAMVIMSFISRAALPFMLIGAILFWLSDGVLMVELLVAPKLLSPAHWTWANWLLYYPAQLLIFIGGINALSEADAPSA
jgi:uncharacterized membrane protein YhhN